MLIKVCPNSSNTVFPQANDIYKILKYVDNRAYKYHERSLSRINMDFVARQESYYKSASQYLGLLEKNSTSMLADKIFRLDKDILMVIIVQLILEKDIFFNYYIKRDINVTKNLLKEKYLMNSVTADRRCTTVKSWIKWCDTIIIENNINIEFN